MTADHRGESPNVAALKAVLTETPPAELYRAPAEHPALAHGHPDSVVVLGAGLRSCSPSCTTNLGVALQALLGTVACESVSASTPPEHIATLVSQLRSCAVVVPQPGHSPAVRLPRHGAALAARRDPQRRSDHGARGVMGREAA